MLIVFGLQTVVVVSFWIMPKVVKKTKNVHQRQRKKSGYALTKKSNRGRSEPYNVYGRSPETKKRGNSIQARFQAAQERAAGAATSSRKTASRANMSLMPATFTRAHDIECAASAVGLSNVKSVDAFLQPIIQDEVDNTAAKRAAEVIKKRKPKFTPKPKSSGTCGNMFELLSGDESDDSGPGEEEQQPPTCHPLPAATFAFTRPVEDDDGL